MRGAGRDGGVQRLGAAGKAMAGAGGGGIVVSGGRETRSHGIVGWTFRQRFDVPPGRRSAHDAAGPGGCRRRARREYGAASRSRGFSRLLCSERQGSAVRLNENSRTDDRNLKIPVVRLIATKRFHLRSCTRAGCGFVETRTKQRGRRKR